MILTINGKQAALKKGSSIEYVSENRIFTDADDYSMEIELPLADCPQNLDIFGMITRKDVDAGDIFFDAVLQDTNFFKRGAVVITGITQESVKVQFLEKRSYQNFFPRFDETYIDELDLGKWPSIYPDNSPTGGGAQPRPGEEVSYASPAQLWGRTEDYTALPWVNNSSGNLQNCAKWNASASKYEWKVNPDDEDDTDFSRGLSFQPYLLWLTKKICEALGYAYDFSLWEQSDYRHLLLMNTTPYANSNRTWASALPHWTVNEFFQELEKLLLCEFDIDHARSTIACTATAANIEAAGTIHISKVVDAFTVEVTTDEEKSGYKAMLNQGYAAGGHRLDNIYNCQWYIDQMTKADGTVRCTTHATLNALISSNVRQEAVPDSGGVWGLHYAQDVDTYFVLEVMKRVKYRSGGREEWDNWGNVTRLVPINRFGPLIIDRDNPDDVDEMKIVPAWLDETDDIIGLVPFLECGETGEGDNAYSNQSHTGRPHSSEKVDQDVPIQWGALPTVSAGKREKSGAVFDKLFVAFWWGSYMMFSPRHPHPWTDTFDLDYSYYAPTPNSNSGVLSVTWNRINSGKTCSLRINNAAYGQGIERDTFYPVDQKKKYTFSFLADKIPNVRSVFHIDGKRYLCEKLTATFTEDGMSHLLKGQFYKITSN